MQLPSRLYGCFAGRRFAHYLEAIGGLNYGSGGFPKRSLIVDEENSDAHPSVSPLRRMAPQGRSGKGC
jgi:hypothetical protein